MRVYRADKRKSVDLPEVLVNHHCRRLYENRLGVGSLHGNVSSRRGSNRIMPGDQRRKYASCEPFVLVKQYVARPLPEAEMRRRVLRKLARGRAARMKFPSLVRIGWCA